MAREDSTLQMMLQILAVAAMNFTQAGLFMIIPPLVCYIIFATKYWWICVLYIGWFLIFDRDADMAGKRRSKWVRSWSWWVYAKNYYPLNVVKLPWGQLDKKRNYLFCYFPHGILSPGSFLSIATDVSEFQKHFTHHTPYLHTMKLFYMIPFLREIGLLLGSVQASKEGLKNILGRENGGNISALVVGGAEESYFSNPGFHKVFYKKRKGFIKVALTHGAPLVPVYVFGENEIFSQTQVDENSILYKIRQFVTRTLGFALLFPVGREDMFGLIPRRRPLTVVVGEPIEVQKIEKPTQEQIDQLHQLFQTKLVELFDSQKKYYLKDHETAQLEIC